MEYDAKTNMTDLQKSVQKELFSIFDFAQEELWGNLQSDFLKMFYTSYHKIILIFGKKNLKSNFSIISSHSKMNILQESIIEEFSKFDQFKETRLWGRLRLNYSLTVISIKNRLTSVLQTSNLEFLISKS